MIDYCFNGRMTDLTKDFRLLVLKKVQSLNPTQAKQVLNATLLSSGCTILDDNLAKLPWLNILDSNSIKDHGQNHSRNNLTQINNIDTPLSESNKRLELLLKYQFKLLQQSHSQHHHLSVNKSNNSNQQLPQSYQNHHDMYKYSSQSSPLDSFSSGSKAPYHNSIHMALFFKGYYPGTRNSRRIISIGNISTSSNSGKSAKFNQDMSEQSMTPYSSSGHDSINSSPSYENFDANTPTSSSSTITSNSQLSSSINCCYHGPLFVISPDRVLEYVQDNYDNISLSNNLDNKNNNNLISNETEKGKDSLIIKGSPLTDGYQLSPWTEFLKESYTIYLQLSDVQYYLSIARKAYLDLDRGRQFRNASLLRGAYDVKDLPKCSPLRLFPNPLVMEDIHRNQMDMQIQMFLKVIGSKIQLLESAIHNIVVSLDNNAKLQKKRSSSIIKEFDQNQVRRNSNKVQLFLQRYIEGIDSNPESYIIPGSRTSKQYTTEHFQSMTWYLQKILMNTLDIQNKLQQYRFEKINQRHLQFMNDNKISSKNNLFNKKSDDIYDDEKEINDLPGLGGKQGSRSLFGLPTVKKVIAKGDIKNKSLESNFDKKFDGVGNRFDYEIKNINDFNTSDNESLISSKNNHLTYVKNRKDYNSNNYSSKITEIDDLINEDVDKEIIEGELSQQLIQELENENEQLLQELESSMDQVRKVTQSLQEVSNLQSQLAYHLEAQREVIDALYDDSWQNTETVQMANIQLIKAQKNFGNAHFKIFIFLLCASIGLLIFDYFS